MGDTEGDETWALLSRDSRPGGRDRKALKGMLGQSLGLRPVTDRLGMREQCLGRAGSVGSQMGHTEAEEAGRQDSWI